MTSYTQYKDPTDTSAAFSPIIWADCPTAEIAHGGIGYDFVDDFHFGIGLVGTITTTIGVSPYTMFGGAGATVTYDGAAGGGLQLFLTDANQGVNIVSEGLSYSITAGAGKLWFEARIKTSTIVTAEQGWFVGLAGAMTQSATVPLTATSALADTNLVGWHGPELNTTAFDAAYRSDGNAAVVVNEDVGALVEGTYVKLGMIFDPTTSTTGTANQLAFFIDGVQQASAKTIPDNTGTDFPADVRMGPCIAVMGAASTDETIIMDWWRCAQLR